MKSSPYASSDLVSSSFSFAILYGLAGVEGGGVIILPVFPLGLESEFIVPLSSLEELATALVPAEELADPLPLDDVALLSFSFAILYGLAGVEGGGVIILPVFPLG